MNATDWYHNIFKKYHPDNSETGDKDKFIKYREAYDKIKDKDNAEVFIKKTLDISIFDAILGVKKEVETIVVEIKPYMAFRQRLFNLKKDKIHLTLRLRIIKPDLSEDDKQLLEEMSKKYATRNSK